ARVRPGRLAADLAPMQKASDVDEIPSVEARVQQLYAERLREILANVGITDPDLTAWESKPPKRKIRAVNTVRLKICDIGEPQDIPIVVADVRQQHGTAALTDFALLKEVLLLAVSIQDAGLSRSVGRPLFQRLFEDIRHAETGFFCEMFVRSLEALAEKHCAKGWPAEQRGRSNAKREVTQF